MKDKEAKELNEALNSPPPTKTLSQLVAEGKIKNRGAKQLASAIEAGVLYDSTKTPAKDE